MLFDAFSSFAGDNVKHNISTLTYWKVKPFRNVPNCTLFYKRTNINKRNRYVGITHLTPLAHTTWMQSVTSNPLNKPPPVSVSTSSSSCINVRLAEPSVSIWCDWPCTTRSQDAVCSLSPLLNNLLIPEDTAKLLPKTLIKSW